MDQLKKSHNLWNINYKKHLSFVAICLQKNSHVKNFSSRVILIFLLFLGMVMYANEVETKEK